MKKILMTGASLTSATGRKMADQIADRYQLLRPSSADLDLADTSAVHAYLKKYRPDVIVHSATHNPKKRPQISNCEENLRMFANFLHAEDYYGKLIFLGSGAEYAKHRNIVEISEDQLGEEIPRDDYGFSKLAQTMYARQIGSKRLVCLRLFGMMNEFEDYSRNFISNLCTKAALNIPLTVRKECRFSFLDVDDLTKMVVWAIDNDTKYCDYNTCNNQYYLLSELAKMVAEISGNSLEISILNPGMNLEYTGDGSRILKESHISCFPMQETLLRLYRYFYDHRSEFDYRAVERAI